jgi:hypothetical protein
MSSSYKIYQPEAKDLEANELACVAAQLSPAKDPAKVKAGKKGGRPSNEGKKSQFQIIIQTL